jgi:hypothetical protein
MLAGLAVGGLTMIAPKFEARGMQPDLSHLSPEQRANVLAMRERMLAALPFQRVTVAGAEALSEWQRLKDAGRGLPIVIGDDAQLERIAEQFTLFDPAVVPYQDGFQLPALRTAQEILTAAEGLEFPADLAGWPGTYRDEDLRAPVGQWRDASAGDVPGLMVATDIQSGRPFDQVNILLIPASASWEVPAHLRWGDWNACPPPEYHIAALRSWHRRCGAELVGINGDSMNLRVSKRPDTRDEALALAREMYRYCPDIVDQGVGTLSGLAAVLMVSDWWFFWWD